MKKGKLILVLVTALLLVAMLLVGCSKTSSTSTATSSSTSTSSTSAAATTLNIGIIEGAQGTLATWGGSLLANAKYACDQVNAAGGLLVGGKRYKFNVIFYENAHMADQSVVAVQKALQQDHCVLIIEGGTPPDAAMAPYTDAAKVIQIGCSFDPFLYGKYPLLFNTLDAPALMAPSVWEQITKLQPTWKKFARISIDFNYDVMQENAEKLQFSKYGLTLVGEAMTEPGATEFSAAITKCMGYNPDAILIGDQTMVSGTIIREIREAGWKGGICSTTTSDGSSDTIAGLKGVENDIDGYITGEVGWNPNPPEMTQFISNWTKDTGMDWNSNGSRTWWPCQVYFAGLQAAGTVTDSTAIAQAIQNVRIKAPYASGNPEVYFCGQQTLGRNCQLSVPFGVTQWQNINGTETPVTVATGLCYTP